MSTTKAWLYGPQYELGETEVHHTEITNLLTRAAEFRMPPAPELWGWGNVRRAERSLEVMAADSAATTLRAAGADPSSVDAVVLCSTRIPGPSEAHGRFMETFLAEAGLGDIPFYGQNLNRCVNLLAAIDTATAFVAAGRHRRVLVVTTDSAADEADRMVSYALFSDGAASCLIAAADEIDALTDGGYEILGCATAQDRQTLDHSHEISADLARTVNDRLLTPLGMKLDDVAGLMHANIFKPVVVMKERQAGFTPEQLHTDNITRVGHCFAADPLINLVDRAALGEIEPGRHYMLAAGVPGQRIGVLIRKAHHG
ncbi:3-oxoacyl-ACP synthase [Streptomyces sporangiiformans]|uniref:3-oxoacyl-ACP synthase n=1 Tax=Streptomyces sporangiiformans TaxID=2315329 RepID=A0A505DLX5_9ACTN|nr:3-oxoacyl-ACP synthase [Streptomyces sporangiiformans]TPQ20899.1 3-oxoacyl-ACP synthase [Streptomyces sporangiiformans]